MKSLLSIYEKSNRLGLKLLWLITAIGLVAAIPLMINRVEMDHSSNRMEFVFDYRDLLDLSEYQVDAAGYIAEELVKLQEAGVHTLAIYESTLDELEMSGALKVYSADEMSLMMGDDTLKQQYRTYVVFTDDATAQILLPSMIEGFGLFDIATDFWSYQGKKGLTVDAGKTHATMIPLDPDPIQMSMLQEKGFRLSARLSDLRPYDHDRMDAQLGRLKAGGVDSIIFAGKQVTGFATDTTQLSLTSMAELMNKHDIIFAVIDQPMEKQQKGVGRLANLMGYEVVRLHSILEEEAFNDPRVLADRFVLAVKDRNFRMIYLNAKIKVDKDQAAVTTPMHELYKSLKDPEFGAVKRIENLGYEIGPAEPFKLVNPGWELIFKAFVFLGAIALIARTAGYYLPSLTLLIFLFGIVCAGGLYVLSPAICVQALALLASISAPTAAIIVAIRSASNRLRTRASASTGAGAGAGAQQDVSGVYLDEFSRERAVAMAAAAASSAGGVWSGFGYSIGLFVRTILLSLVGAVYTVALLNHISYMLVLNQFRGVSLLHTLPILLAALYAFFFHGAGGLLDVLGRFKRFLTLHIQIVWVAAAGVIGIVLMYYLTRTGNNAMVLPLDREFRALLENTLGIRPRTKELLTHPLFIMGIFLFMRYGKRAALALVVAGSMAQLSVVDTFAHLHTPLWISALRVLYGAVISIGIALVYLAAWELLVRGWNRWRTYRLPQE
jgi:hypothetical protein